MSSELYWLPAAPDWAERFSAARKLSPPEQAAALRELANFNIDFLQTTQLDKAIQKITDAARAEASAAKPVRLALLGSSTLGHLVPGIRVAAYRRGLWVDVHEGDYGLFRHELEGAARDAESRLARFKPDVLLLALDAATVAAGSADEALAQMRACWQLAQKLGCVVVQQTVLPVMPPLLGSNEHRGPASPFAVVAQVNAALRAEAPGAGVHLLALDAFAQEYGLRAWHDAALWHRAKQEVHPRMSHLYGEHVARLLAALRGRSAKALVLDLDNTLWGGVIGDDGLEGIVLGQGSAVGESHVALQRYARALAGRGIVLAVCSKNDEANALAPFTEHPEMVLKREDIAIFVANWQDKATNLRDIAARLNLGLDALVFLDDNPFERNLVRQELPMVAVPELPEDPAEYVAALAAAGYFETVEVTEDDRQRAAQYQANAARDRERDHATDLDAYLRSLDMQLVWKPFDTIGLARITQLVNKTNQFNLTTRRYTEAEIRALMNDANNVTLQLRLTDRYGDNGIISLLIGRMRGDVLEMDTWLMSCRVLGRQVEEATLNLLVEQARAAGAREIEGVFIPTKKNSMVRDHYPRLGFAAAGDEADGVTRWRLAVDTYQPRNVWIQEKRGQDDRSGDLLAAHHHLS